MEYITTTKLDAKSFSQGIGISFTTPKQKLSLTQVIDHLERNPNDGFMHNHLLHLKEEDPIGTIDEAVKRFEKKPSIITFGLLAKTQIGNHPNAIKAMESYGNTKKLMSFFRNHYSDNVRGTLFHEQLVANAMWSEIYNQNRTGHVAFADMNEIKVPFPEIFLEEAENMPEYRHVKNFIAQATNKSHNSSTSIRAVSPEETYERIDEELFDKIVGEDTQIIGHGFCGTYAISVPWQMDLKVSIGKHNYTLNSQSVSSGKGVDHITAQVSGILEMFERYSAGLGCTENFPDGFEETQNFTKAKQSQLEKKGVNFLDLESLSTSIPFMDHSMHWVVGTELTKDGQSPIHVPAQLVYMFSNLDEVNIFDTSSNGLASGNTMEEAKLHSLFEIIERDGDYRIFYSPDRVFKLSADDGKIAEIIGNYKDRGLEIQVLDLTSEFGIPTYRAFVQVNGQILSGSGTHLDGKIAATRAICELSPKCLVWEKNVQNAWKQVINPGEEVPVISYSDLPNYSSGNVDLDLKVTENTLTENGFNPTYVNLTRTDVGFPVVRTIVPGLEIPGGMDVRQYKNFMKQADLEHVKHEGLIYLKRN